MITAIDFYGEAGRKLPEPSKPQPGDLLVTLPLSVVAKVMLLNTMVDQKIRLAELARLLGVKSQEVTRLTNLHHTTKIDSVERAMRVMGKQLTLSIA